MAADANQPPGEEPRLSPEDRIARNEAAFRDVNERIANGQWPGDADAPIAFRCECGNLGCLTGLLAGRRRPTRGAHGGRGLWTANQVANLVQMRTFAEDTVVRIHMLA